MTSLRVGCRMLWEVVNIKLFIEELNSFRKED